MIVLTLLLLFLIVIGGTTIKKKKRGIEISFILMGLIASLRYNVGYDYKQYLAIYRANPKCVNLITGHLLGTQNFGIIPKAIYNLAILTKFPQLIFIVFSGATILLTYRFVLSNSKNLYLSMLIYITLFYLDTFSTIRQALAVAVTIWGFKYVKEKKLLTYVIIIGIASIIHSIAIIALPIYFIYNNCKLKIIMIASVCIVIGGNLIIKIILNFNYFKHYAAYFDGTIENNGASKVVLMFYLVVSMCLFLTLVYGKNSNDIKQLMSIVLCGVVFPLLLGTQSGIRVASFYFQYLILLVPELYERTFKNEKSKMIAMIPFEVYYVLYLFVDSLNDKGYTLYQMFFGHI